MPELIFITGCNAAGKSTFIRTRLNELEGFEILITDVKTLQNQGNTTRCCNGLPARQAIKSM